MTVGILHRLTGPVDRVGVVISVEFLELWVYHHVVPTLPCASRTLMHALTSMGLLRGFDTLSSASVENLI